MTLESSPSASPQGTQVMGEGSLPEAYLGGWKGLSRLVLAEAGVAVSDDGLVKVPSRGIDGTTIRTHYFKKDGMTWWSSGVGLTLFGLETIHPSKLAARSSLIFVEGESSALAVSPIVRPHLHLCAGDSWRGHVEVRVGDGG